MNDGNRVISIAPAPTTVQWNGRTVNLTPLTVGQMPAFARAVLPFAAKLANSSSFGADDILGLIADYGEHVIEALSIATRIDRSEIGNASPADLIVLIAPLITANASFFGVLRAAKATAHGPTGGVMPS